MHNEASFAGLCGASPVEASSGRVTRHRLNRGGDREANHALWRIVMVRLTCDKTTQAYVERRRADGRSDREIVRCLKRDIAREIYRLLTDPPAIPAGTTLRQRRRQAGVPLRVVAEAFNSWPARISQLERGLKHDADLATRSSLWLDPQGVPA